MQPPGDNGSDDLRGQRLGAYEIVELIGRGGMAVVYRARQPVLARQVAIKVLPPYYLRQPDFRARFEREAQTAARLEHPHILPIYDYGQAGEIPYIVMRLVEGGTLREWLKQGVPLARALAVFRGLLSAVKYAHSCQPAVIHRDINPKNVLMGHDDWPLLADFGIAKILEPAVGVTSSGTMIGTPEYIAPEQSQGTSLDHRSDLYAMGAVLFEILTGRPPFQGPTPLSVVLQHVGAQVPSVHTFNPDLPLVWDEIIQRSMAKNPEDRYPSAQALDEAVESASVRTLCEQDAPRPARLEATIAGGGRSPGWVRRIATLTHHRRWPMRRKSLIAVIAVLVLIAGIRIASLGLFVQPTAVPATLLPVRVYVAENGNNRIAVVNPVTHAIETVIPVGVRPGLIVGNAAGTRIYVTNSGSDTVSVIDPASSSVMATVSVGIAPFGLTIVPSGRYVYVANFGSSERPGSTVSVIDAVTDTVVATVVVGNEPAGIVASPDGRWVYAANNASGSVSVIDTARNSVVATVTVGARPAGVAITPDGARVYVANGGEDTVSVIDTASTIVLATILVGSKPSGIAARPDGRRIYVANEESDNVSVLDTDGNRVITTVSVGSRPFDIAVSPEGSRIFVTTYGDRSVAVIDTGGHTVLARVRVGLNPLGVGIKP